MPRPLFISASFLLYFFILFYPFCSHAQDLIADSLEPATKGYNLSNPQQVLFVQTDKTIYTNNESIWFAGYLLHKEEQSAEADVLAVCLVQKETRQTVLQKNYLITDDLCAGSMLLPDSIAPGNYELIASINVVSTKGFLAWFRQEITIKSTLAQALTTTFTIDTLAGSSPNLNIAVKVQLPDGGIAANATLTYHLQNQKPKTIGLDSYGKGVISIAKAELTPSDYVLQTFAQYKDKTHSFNLILPFHRADADSIKTKVYSDSGMMETGNVVADDTLLVLLKNKGNNKVKIAISNTTAADTSQPVWVRQERTVKIPLDAVSKGIHTIDVLDSSNHLLAKRLFFAHWERRNTCLIQADSDTYKTRENVNLKIKLADDAGNNISGIVTVSCVQKGRIDTGKQKDLTSYFYLHQLTNLFANNSLRNAYANKTNLERLLLQGAGSYYTSPDFIAASKTDSSLQTRRLTETGQVYKNNKFLKKPVQLILKFDSTLASVQTDANGSFSLPAADITVAENRPVYVMVEGKNNVNYAIVTKDALGEAVAKAIENMPVETTVTYLPTQNSKETFLNDSLVKVNVLPGVVVTTKEKLYGTGAATANPVNACGDYLCYGGILNCPIHPPRYRPIKGERYYVYHVGMVTYQGCWSEEEQHLHKVNAVYTSREWYGMDSLLLAQSAPEYMSTIYWKPFVAIDKETPVELSFYTSDLPGIYTIRIAGVGSNGEVVSEEKEIRVMK